MPLYIVATPIGNLEDLTVRALNVLRDADLIACEDTRHSGRLLAHFDIKVPLISYHEHNERERADELLQSLKAGRKVALITDAGTPGISDPAYRVVVSAIEAGINVVPIPGPVALIAALVASGQPTDTFFFGGFLPTRQAARRAKLAELSGWRTTLVFYEAPHRIRQTLADAVDVLGDREATLARELTKLHEEFVRGPLGELHEWTMRHEPRGEMTLVIAPAGDDNFPRVGAGSVSEQIEQLVRNAGLDRSEALKEVARLRGISRREAYRLLVEETHAPGEPENEADSQS
jgi:16S rRNA (cytidine1402-2'-O)-methyltransferase